MRGTVSILDYGMANLRSVQKAFEQVGHRARIISQPEQIDAAERSRAVAKFLTSQGGLDAKTVDTRAFGSTQPKKTKEASRRVEIVVATR